MTANASKVCGCGREIVRRVAAGRWPVRCTICRPRAAEPTARPATVVEISPDGWPAPEVEIFAAFRSRTGGGLNCPHPRLKT